MKTKQEQIAEMAKIIKTERKMLGSQIKVIKKRLNNKYVEIEQLKAKNWRLTKKLRQVLLSIDTVKEMNTMCNIGKQIEQAVEEFAEKLKEYINNKVIADFDDSDSVEYYTIDLDEFESEIDELLKEYKR